ncbi:fucose permease [Friedmanniella endophytica]|uniref:Fucose permease n=1 Tax=Microlunatus kandeliicorticis TaxID=1759536 RepID=A0A7W3IVL0_9ACTN|nr:MFS transporter [Microlunatus kandeliicorticis]MBA8796057.1 fucose permease [Microlunatus kandeliicorticis]
MTSGTDGAPATGTRPAAEVRGAVGATYLAFIATGFAFASWASRIPQVRDHFRLDPAQLGLVLLAIAAGSLIALPLSGVLVSHLGSRRTVRLMAVLDGVALLVVSAGFLLGVPVVVVGLFLFGFGQGAWDVAMNVQGALAERRLGRAIMPRFHAGFSVGTVAGALTGAAMVALRVPVSAHLLVVGVLVAVVVPFGVRRFLPDHDHEPATASALEAAPGPTAVRLHALRAWREPRTVLIGVFVLTFAFAEGTGNDWTSVALIDGYRLPASLGTLGFAVFLAAMTAGRWFGPGLLDRHGRVVVIRVMAGLAVLGVALFVFGQLPVVAFLGLVLWGVGTSLGFPVGMSAGADEPAMAAPRVSVIASVGYCAFLGGPPLVGFLGDHVGVLRAVVVVAALLALAVAITGVTRPPAAAGSTPDPAG